MRDAHAQVELLHIRRARSLGGRRVDARLMEATLTTRRRLGCRLTVWPLAEACEVPAGAAAGRHPIGVEVEPEDFLPRRVHLWVSAVRGVSMVSA